MYLSLTLRLEATPGQSFRELNAETERALLVLDVRVGSILFSSESRGDHSDHGQWCAAFGSQISS